MNLNLKNIKGSLQTTITGALILAFTAFVMWRFPALFKDAQGVLWLVGGLIALFAKDPGKNG